MALDFPAPAIEGQTFVSNGATFVFHRSRWMMIGQTILSGDPTGYMRYVADDPDPHLGGNLVQAPYFINGLRVGVDVQPYSSVLSATSASFTTTDEAKLDSLPSSAQYTSDLNAKANIESPTFLGTVQVPTPPVDSNDQRAASTAFVVSKVGSPDPTILRSNASATLTKGFDAVEYNLGVVSTGTLTPNPANGQLQRCVNGGPFIIVPPATTTTMMLLLTNNSSAGIITPTGFTKVTGDELTPLDGNDYFIDIRRIGGFSHLHVTGLQ